MTKPTVYWTLFEYEDWKLHLASTSKGICYIGSQDRPLEDMAAWIEKRYPGLPFIQDHHHHVFEIFKVELMEYFQGKRLVFHSSFDFHGTPFQKTVWEALCQISYGQTKSYSDVAREINKPDSVRAVAAAIGANPILISVPCHRVIGKNGKLTGYRGGLDMKTKLLELEGCLP
jgi:methylated-DNA-[protein]-cysteine S-methyltransferase